MNGTDFLNAIAITEFGARALRFLKHPSFQKEEIDYKLDLAQKIQNARIALQSDNPQWVTMLQKAVKSREDNIINWRLQAQLFNCWDQHSRAASHALSELWDNTKQLHERLEIFGGTLTNIGLTQPGAQQLPITSVLLMANGAASHPPVRTRVLSYLLTRLNLPKIGTDTSMPERYELFISLLDALIEYSQASERPLRNRLEAQGVVWCETGGWDSTQSNLDQQFSPDLRQEEERIEDEISEADAELSKLGETERKTVVAARRGQGRYRDDLLNLWNGCAITTCTAENILRASHLKPWKESTNEERLDKFNGLLLTPNLDILLDRCLISFTEEGNILISSSISVSDRSALGLGHHLRLRFVQPQHRPYLAFHRRLFEERERALIP